jgi:uncharacterized integral membrane protein
MPDTIVRALMQPWDEFMLIVHIGAALIAASLFCTAPDRTAKGVLLLVILAMLIMVTAYALRLSGLFADRWWVPENVKVLAYAVDHGVILLYLTRLMWKEKLSCKSLSRNSRYFLD